MRWVENTIYPFLHLKMENM